MTSVSIVMPVYNAQAFIREAIDSILRQTFEDFELLALDDGSTDRSAEIISAYSDPRIHYIKCPHDFIATLNRGIEEAQGKYIARMDADDVMMPERLKEQYEYMEQHPETAACGSAIRMFGARQGEVVYEKEHDEIVNLMVKHNPQEYRHNISLDFQRVWQTGKEISEPGTTNKSLHDLYESVASLGFAPSHASSTFSCGKAVRCYSDRFYHTVINYTGKIHKCTLHLEREAGILNEDGTISWHQEVMQKIFAKATFDNEKCIVCKHLPICLGPCSQKLYNCPKDVPCELENSEITTEQFIIDFFNRKMDSIKNKHINN